jgi:hypothetical protein
MTAPTSEGFSLSSWIGRIASLGAMGVLAESKEDSLRDARAHYAEAERMFETLEIAPERAHAWQGLGGCLLRLGETSERVAHLTEARALWMQMKAALRIAKTDELLATTSISGSGFA